MGAAVASTESDEPMMDINTTPLIDVMLVLLIMFIITIPIQTHAVEIDLPQPTNSPPPPVLPTKNKIVIMPDGAILWNEARVDIPTLQRYLELSTQMNPVPELHLQPHPDARYGLVDEVLGVTKKANVTSMGFVGNEAYGAAF